MLTRGPDTAWEVHDYILYFTELMITLVFRSSDVLQYGCTLGYDSVERHTVIRHPNHILTTRVTMMYFKQPKSSAYGWLS